MSNDYAETGTEAIPAGGIYRWLPVVVVMTAVVGFVTLAWYAYTSGTQSLKEDDLLIVEADKTPMKEKPLDPGGMKFPNQDKTVFEAFTNGSVPPKVERVMPPPEEPMSKNMDTSETQTWVSDTAQHKENTVPVKEALIVSEKKKPEQVPAVASQPKQASADIKTYKAEAAAAPVSDKVAEVAAAAVQAVNNNAPQAEEAKQPAPKTTGGSAKIQLGAYKSEKEAQDAWAKMQKKFGELSGRSFVIVKADLGAKGIYYRLRANVDDSKTVCTALAKQNQACIPVN